MFLKLPTSEKLILEQRYFVIGEKGTGKTALALELKTSKEDQISAAILSLERNDFYNFLDWTRNLPQAQVDLDQSETWETMLMIMSFVNLYNLQAKDRADSEDTQPSTLYDLLLRLSGSAEPFRFSELFDLLCWNRISFYSCLHDAFPNKFKDEMPQFYRSYIRVIKTFFLDLLVLLRPIAYINLLFIDGLDSFSSVVPGSPSSATADERMRCASNLVLAVWNLNTRVFGEEIRKRFRLVALVRPEIFDRAGILNKNNVAADHGVFLNWYTRDNLYKFSDIFRLACNILDSQQPSKSPADVAACNKWDEYFPQRILFGERMHDAFVMFLTFSFYRPRDIIHTFQILRNAMIAFNRGNSKQFDVALFNNNEVQKALCDSLMGEAGEAAAFYYNVNDSQILTTFFNFLAQQTGGKQFFSFPSFVKAFDLFISSRSRQTESSSAIVDTPENFLQFLFELNVIGFYAREEGRSGSHRIFSFQQRAPNRIRPIVMPDTQYVVHRGFARYLLVPGR